MKHRKEFLLVIFSLFGAVALSEVTVRLMGLGRGPVSLEQAGAAADKPLDASAAMKYIAALPAAPGTDRAWFLENLPPLLRTKPEPSTFAAYREFESRGLFPPQSEYIWNRLYVESERCRPNGRLAGFPPSIPVFDPPQASVHPRYRFPAGVTTIPGLVTNQFGLRGRPVERAKPPRTVRIAFVGASTTIDYHYFAYSYPEYVEYWLNRFARAANLDVRFEALNAGREGIGSADIAAIVNQELLPLDPDLTVYYEGSNQFLLGGRLIVPWIPPRDRLDPNDQVIRSRVPPWWRDRLVLARLLDGALAGMYAVGEPRKPEYRLEWPAAINERNPDPHQPGLPLSLDRIVGDLESIRTATESVGGELAVSSFMWLVRENLALSPVRHAGIYRQLNTFLWPLRYRDARRLAEFQNRVFRNYAVRHTLPFLDVAGALPGDPELFLDAIHLTETGTRVKAWIVFQQLLPMVRERLASGRWPRPAGARPLPPAPSLAVSRTTTACVFPSGPLEAVPGAVSMTELSAEYGVPPVEPGPPLKVSTSAVQYSFGARAPLRLPKTPDAPLGVVVRGRSLNGRIGLGILDPGNDLQAETAVAPSPKSAEIWLPVVAPERASAIVIRNLAENGLASQMLVEDVRVVRRPRTVPK